MMALYANGQTVELDVPPRSFDRGRDRLRETHTTPSGNQFHYDHGGLYRAKFDVDLVSSADAAKVNGWWRSREPVQFNELYDPPLATGSAFIVPALVLTAWVSSLFIANRTAPIVKPIAGNTDRWRGTIELESF